MATTRKTTPRKLSAATSGTRNVVDAAISITSKTRKTVTVNLDGVTYMVKPPKTALTMKLAVRGKQAEERPELFIDAMSEWVFAAFGLAQGEKIQQRLDDGDDDLDIETLTDLMAELGEYETGDPTS